jgi:hypothetical protein
MFLERLVAGNFRHIIITDLSAINFIMEASAILIYPENSALIITGFAWFVNHLYNGTYVPNIYSNFAWRPYVRTNSQVP